MASKSHNKRRNSGLLYEFLVRFISSALVEGEQKRSSMALKILKKYFKPGTQLHKEFRLISSLVKTTVSSEFIAASILQEAKAAARDYDEQALDREKSLLIKEINHKLNDSMFYDQHVHEYRTYATIQQLLNDWRSKASDFERVATYEDQLVRHLMTEKAVPGDAAIEVSNPGTNRLLMKILMTKLNEKYSDALSATQKEIIKEYVWSTTTDDPQRIKTKLCEVKESLLRSIDSFKDPSEQLVERLGVIKQQLQQEAFDVLNDETIARVMLYMKLHDELTSEEQ